MLAASSGLDLATSVAAAAGPTEWLSVKDFGVRGDGATDESEALLRLRDYIKFRSDIHFHIHFPPGKYIYDNNRWLLGVHSISLNGSGAKLQCVSNNAWEANKRPLNMHSLFYDIGVLPISSPIPYHSGYKIVSVEAGISKLRLAAADSSSKFKPGDRVFIHGFDQQFSGWPPNLRYFEWNEILSTDPSDGTLILRSPLTNCYDERWSDFFNGSFAGGKPRVLNLVREKFYYPVYIEMMGFEFLNNPNAQYNGLQISADVVRLTDSICRGNFYPTESRVFEASRLTVDGLAEVDKLCGRVSIAQSVLREVTAGTGVDEIELDGCELNARVNLKPRRLVLKSCRIRPRQTDTRAISLYQDSFPGSFARFLNCTVDSSSFLSSVVDNGKAKALVVESVNTVGSIRLADTVSNRLIIRDVAVGTMFYAPVLSDSGRVTGIWMDEGYFLIAGTWRAMPIPGETWTYYTMAEISISGLTFSGAKCRIPAVHRPFQLRMTENTNGGRYTIDSDFSFTSSADVVEANGFLQALRARVVAPYAGVDASPVLRVVLRDGAWLQEVAVMSLKEAGYVELWPDRTYATSAATTAVKIPAGRPVRFIDLKYKNGGLPLSGSVEQMPRLSVELDLMPLSG